MKISVGEQQLKGFDSIKHWNIIKHMIELCERNGHTVLTMTLGWSKDLARAGGIDVGCMV